MEHFSKQRGSDCAALAFSNLSLACGFFFFLKEDKHEEFYDLGKSELCREAYEQQPMNSFRRFFNRKFFEYFDITDVPMSTHSQDVGFTKGAYKVQELMDELARDQVPQLLSIRILAEDPKKNFGHRVAYVPDDEGNYHIIDQAVLPYRYSTERVGRRFAKLEKSRGVRSEIIWLKVRKNALANEEDQSLSYYEYSRKYGNTKNMQRFIDLREQLMKEIKPQTPNANKVVQDTLALNVRSVKKIISMIENGEHITEARLDKLLSVLEKTEKIPSKMGQQIDDADKDARRRIIFDIRKWIQEYRDYFEPIRLKGIKKRLLPELKSYVDIAKKLTFDDTDQGGPSAEDEAGPSKRARTDDPPEDPPVVYKKGPYTLYDDDPPEDPPVVYKKGPYTLYDDDPPDNPEGGVDRRLRYVDEVRKHSKQYYNGLVREGVPPREARERTASHIFMVRHYMSRGYNLQRAHELALRSEEFGHFTDRTRRRLAQIMDSDSDGGSVQRLYRPVGGMVYTK